MIEQASPQDLSEFKLGHAHDSEAGTGCSVIIAPQGATGAVDVRGGGPATRETDLLKPENMIEAIHGIVLAGGSAYGLAASDGVMNYLEEHKIGFSLQGIYVPIVCGACLFDLGLGENVRPDAAMGYRAAQAAFSDEVFAEGNVGAGAGASVGKLLGPERAMKSGFGMQFLRLGDLVVGALVAVNALGSIQEEQGQWIAGPRGENNEIVGGLESFLMLAQSMSGSKTSPCTNTTLGVILTNAKLTKAQATKISSGTHDAFARTIKPVHTSNDGDTIFTLASDKIETMPDLVTTLANEAMQQAIYRGITQAKGAFGLPAACDIA